MDSIIMKAEDVTAIINGKLDHFTYPVRTKNRKGNRIKPKCKYQVGDVLWVQEEYLWDKEEGIGVYMDADEPLLKDDERTKEQLIEAGVLEVIAASNMADWASRLRIEVTEIAKQDDEWVITVKRV